MTTNYATLDDKMLCRSCNHGQIIESSQGHTMIRCHYGNCDGSAALTINFIVTRCDKHEQKQLGRIWDTAERMKIEDGHCWVMQYLHNLGQVWVRADTLHMATKIIQGHDEPIETSKKSVTARMMEAVGI